MSVSNKKEQKPNARPRSYTPLHEALKKPFCFADTELDGAIKRHGVIAAFGAVMSRKRREDGEPLGNALAGLLVWPLLGVQSIHCFCAELAQIIHGKASVLYDLMGREDINWRQLSSGLARRVCQQNELGAFQERAFVADDSIVSRRGRKVEGSSAHFDHNKGQTVQGHQLLQLGLAGQKGMVPLEAQLVMSDSNPVNKRDDKPFKDNRSAAARDMRRSWQQTKHEHFRAMLGRALEKGLRARYVLADAWFACKENISRGVELGLTVIFQMKRGNLTYRYQAGDYTVTELYAKVHRRMRAAHRKARYKTASLKVHLNVKAERGHRDQWLEVRLVFSAPVGATDPNAWVVFLCTDTSLSENKILQTYALRWSVEVYFKELKQHLGLLKEQSGRYQVAYASVHLAAIRYLLLFEAMLRNGNLTYGEIRDRQSGQLQVLTYATLLWELFRAIIEGALESLKDELGSEIVQRVTEAINETVENFLAQALHIKPDQISIDLKAEQMGYI